MHRIFLGPAFLAAVVTSSVFAAGGKTLPFPTDAGSGIKIEIESWLDACPPCGMASFVWRITNGSAASREWTLTVSDSYNANLSTTLHLKVEAGRTVELPFAAAAGSSAARSYYRTMNFGVVGYGARASFAQLQQPDTLSRGSHAASTPFLAISAEVAAKGWSELSDKFDKSGGGSGSTSGGGIGFDASQADLSRAPDEWRGYSGLSQLWMTDGEWSALGNGVKLAIMDWIALGGRVVLFVPDTSEAALAALKLPPRNANGECRHAAGSIVLQSWDGRSFPLEQAFKLAAAIPGDRMETQLGQYGGKWNLRESVAAPSLRALLVFGFIVAFGVLVGPVNLYWFAGPKRRQRLFWTTPLISLAGSALLVALMILQDGIGGNGARRVLALMLPGQNKIAIVQEQISRSGVLLGRSFAIEEPSWMQQLPGEPSGTGISTLGNSGRRLAESDQRQRSGDWFTNRAVQAQMIEAVRPSRGRIEFFPGKSDQDPPAVLSSLGTTLAQVFVMDEQNRYWRAEEVGTGEKRNMQPATQGEFQGWMRKSAIDEMGPVSAAVYNAIKDQPGQAYAVCHDASKFAVKSLDSIRWSNDRVFFAGPYVRR